MKKTTTALIGTQVLKNWRDRNEKEDRLVTCYFLLGSNCSRSFSNKYVELLLLEIIHLKEVRGMTLEARLISNSNAFFAIQDKSPLVADEYEKQFQIALMTQKKPLPTAIGND